MLLARYLGANATLVAVGRGARPTAVIGTIPRPRNRGGLGGVAADDQYLAFSYDYGAGDAVQNSWTMYVWSPDTGLKTVAHNPVDASGHPISGGFVDPVLSGHYLYWIQAVLLGAKQRQPGSELMQYDISSGRTRTIYSGLVTSAVPYHDDVLFSGATAAAMLASGRTTNPDTTLLAADQATGAAMAPPAGLDLGTDDPSQMVTNGDVVVWDSDNGGLRAWRPAWGRTRTLMPSLLAANLPPNLENIAQTNDLDVSGHFIVWDSPDSYAFDLRTGSIASLSGHRGEVNLAGDRLEFWQYTSAVPPKTAGPYTYSAYLLNLSTLPDLPACH